VLLPAPLPGLPVLCALPRWLKKRSHWTACCLELPLMVEKDFVYKIERSW
jgi:hypothetical protein